MPTTYTDQFWTLDPFSPPGAGTLLTFTVYDIIDQNDDDFLTGAGGDTINGIDITQTYLGDTVTVDIGGTPVTITGATFYLANGTQVFTPTDGTVLQDVDIISATGVPSQSPVPVALLPPPCLVRDTLISTPEGERKVQDLRAGDRVLDLDGVPMSLRSVMSRSIPANELRAYPKLRPVRICAGALGNGLPHRDLLVSRQHRMLVASKIVERMFAAKEVLIPAIKLTTLPGIYIDESVETVEYFHLLFDRHEVILAESAPTESLYLGREALKSVSAEARQEIYAIFPDLKGAVADPIPARPIPSGKRQKKLVARHAANQKPLVQPESARA
ncbi:Hint domain-containing protein [Sedimentitalea todarodis]|uniref:Hint domain-containing protein n=1 Tax=Sedimentitalea todarodis TaxID=1631240 RepID=A0ABU3VGA6_9RHOB|nr:Hint domain-containing protein [Sedimentitalea todarodis]MDU9005213.1 Hint domain-containing protein [Sedimentitalea todarodis]